MASAPTMLVTGGARRLGAAIARRFGEAGWHVVIHYHTSREDAQRLADSLPSAEVIRADLSDEVRCAGMMAELADRLADWRVLINSAGVFEPDEPGLLDAGSFSRAMTTNARAAADLALRYLAQGRAEGGRHVIQITDQKVANPNPDFLSYSMSKFAVSGTVPMLGKLPLGANDRVYGLAPGAILASHDQSDAETDVSHRLNLLGRKTGANEIADAALFLASGALATGQTLYVDSGQWLLDQPRDVIYLARTGGDSKLSGSG